MLKRWITNHTTLVAIAIFLVAFLIVQAAKPAFIYNRDGSLKQFGVGYKNKTIMPIWLLSFVLGILAYLVVLYIKLEM